MNYNRLTNTNKEEYDPELDFCTGCKYYGEPNGCNRPDGTCDSYDRFIETYQRLEALEDKNERINADRKEALMRSCLNQFEEYYQPILRNKIYESFNL